MKAANVQKRKHISSWTDWNDFVSQSPKEDLASILLTPTALSLLRTLPKQESIYRPLKKPHIEQDKSNPKKLLAEKNKEKIELLPLYPVWQIGHSNDEITLFDILQWNEQHEFLQIQDAVQNVEELCIKLRAEKQISSSSFEQVAKFSYLDWELLHDQLIKKLSLSDWKNLLDFLKSSGLADHLLKHLLNIVLKFQRKKDSSSAIPTELENFVQILLKYSSILKIRIQQYRNTMNSLHLNQLDHPLGIELQLHISEQYFNAQKEELTHIGNYGLTSLSFVT